LKCSEIPTQAALSAAMLTLYPAQPGYGDRHFIRTGCLAVGSIFCKDVKQFIHGRLLQPLAQALAFHQLLAIPLLFYSLIMRTATIQDAFSLSGGTWEIMLRIQPWVHRPEFHASIRLASYCHYIEHMSALISAEKLGRKLHATDGHGNEAVKPNVQFPT